MHPISLHWFELPTNQNGEGTSSNEISKQEMQLSGIEKLLDCLHSNKYPG